MAFCHDCAKPYGGPDWIEALVPDPVWEEIKPQCAGKGGGTLCISCIAKRIRYILPEGTRVPVWLVGTEPLEARAGDPGADPQELALLRTGKAT